MKSTPICKIETEIAYLLHLSFCYHSLRIRLVQFIAHFPLNYSQFFSPEIHIEIQEFHKQRLGLHSQIHRRKRRNLWSCLVQLRTPNFEASIQTECFQPFRQQSQLHGLYEMVVQTRVKQRESLEQPAKIGGH